MLKQPLLHGIFKVFLKVLQYFFFWISSASKNVNLYIGTQIII